MTALVYFVGGTILIALFINLFKNDDELNFKTLKYLLPASLISALLLIIFLVY
jgi:amino acid transporter|tara:strand:+ start:5831 stop:5989 length:159 start_codon:yes stop_codon:yes gene_type:complete